MDYFVNGKILHIGKGEGIFVNSKRLHYCFSDNNTDCSFLVIVVHPTVLGENTPAGKAFFEAKFGYENDDYLVLSSQIQWQKDILTFIQRIFSEIDTARDNPLHVLSLVESLCACVADKLQLVSVHVKSRNANAWLAVRNMTGFIFQNYEGRITLEDIAAAGSVCRSKCCHLFGEYIGQSPITYLTGYRIRKSCEMLKESDMSVLEIAAACGFKTPSYFTQIFRKEIGLPPKEYRNQWKENN
jgi:AraC-like DNA-binding protein